MRRPSILPYFSNLPTQLAAALGARSVRATSALSTCDQSIVRFVGSLASFAPQVTIASFEQTQVQCSSTNRRHGASGSTQSQCNNYARIRCRRSAVSTQLRNQMERCTRLPANLELAPGHFQHKQPQEIGAACPWHDSLAARTVYSCAAARTSPAAGYSDLPANGLTDPALCVVPHTRHAHTEPVRLC